MLEQNYVLPMVDISNLCGHEFADRVAVAHQLDQACQEVGFLYIKGDQFDAQLFQNLVAIAQAYFAQDEASKMQDYIGNVK